jgi:hypothetical protein
MGALMIVFSEPSLLNDLGQGLIVLGLVGAVSLFFFPEDRRILERSLGVLFTLAVIGGVALTWRADKLRNADRDLTPAQQAALSKAISQFPTIKFEVFTSRGNSEAHSLALKTVDAVKAGSGAMPVFDDKMLSLPVGLVFVLGKDTDPDHTFADTVGRLLMAARIAVISDRTVDLDEHTVRIVVGERP